MKRANEYGFLPGNDGLINAQALQTAVNSGGKIIVELPGIYDLSETVEIGNDTTIIFSKGVQIRRQSSVTGRNGCAFINKGFASGEYNRNISLFGLHLDCNGTESADWGVDSRLVGLRAHVGMINISNLVIEDFECTGLLKKDYAIQVCAFKNICLENLYITGEKDGVHLGWGKGFVIRNGRFRTFDDPIALNAFDYSVSNTHVGWIENGIIENCCDLSDDTTTGFFCRILGGAWCDWYEGMKVQHSDTVCSCGRVYRVVMQPDGEVYTSHTRPEHSVGVKEYDGINWVCVRNEAVYDCGCRNIVLRDIRLQKRRHCAVGISLNYDNYARSFYAGCKIVAQSGIVLERVSIENEIKYLLESNYPSENIKIIDTDLKDSKVYFRSSDIDGLSYPAVDITLSNVVRKNDSIVFDENHPVNIKDI
ncbi:MAG: hypothetical protein IJB86_08135 [Clostridia bacterium]|nr:hypothetical protein [Clostridia bacterium]